MATFGEAGIPITFGILGFWAYAWSRGYPALGFVAWAAEAGMLTAILAILIGLLPMDSGTARRVACMDNLKEIQLGILNYEAANGTLRQPS